MKVGQVLVWLGLTAVQAMCLIKMREVTENFFEYQKHVNARMIALQDTVDRAEIAVARASGKLYTHDEALLQVMRAVNVHQQNLHLLNSTNKLLMKELRKTADANNNRWVPSTKGEYDIGTLGGAPTPGFRIIASRKGACIAGEYGFVFEGGLKTGEVMCIEGKWVDQK